MSEAGTTQTGDPIIQLKGVVKAFDGKRVIDGLTLDIQRGETIVVMGGSGSGKSTTLRLMIGSIEADEGAIRICGTDIVHANEEELNAVRLKLGVLFQSGALFNSMTLAENVAL
ncbi:MAG: ATP-binding cassette domain-containing protein, partial [Phycisphaerales bacterium JB061]